MAQVETPRPKPRVSNTPFETGLRSVVILTAGYPDALGLTRLLFSIISSCTAATSTVPKACIRRIDLALLRSWCAAICAQPSANGRYLREGGGRSRRIVFSNGSRAGASSGFRRLGMPVFSARSAGA